MPPPSTPCPSCGQNFFPSALRFHVPQCQKKQALMLLPCPACGVDVRQSEMNEHMRKCPVAQRRFAKRGGASTGAGGRSGPTGGTFGTPSTAGRPTRRSAAPQMAIQPASSDGRVRCAVCGRNAPDRIAKHQFVCAGLKAGPARDPVKVATAAAAVTAARAPRERTRAPPQPRGGQRWRAQSEEFRAAMRAARGGGRRGGGGYSGYSRGGYSGGYEDDTGGGGGGGYGGGGGSVTGLLPCPHCTRTFSQAAWERHVPRCQFIVAKPSPVRRSGGPPHSAAVSGWRRESERSRFALASSRQSRTSGTFGAAPPRPRPTPHVLSGGGGGGGIDPSNRTSADNPLIGGLGAYTR